MNTRLLKHLPVVFALTCLPVCFSQIISGVFTGTIGSTAGAVQPVDSNGGTGGCTGSSPSWSCGSSPTITLTTSTGSATICYRVDGVTITVITAGTCPAGSTTYSTSFAGPGSTFTLTAVATKIGLSTSSQLSSVYTITPPGLSVINGAAGYQSASSNVSASALTLSTADQLWMGAYYTVTTGTCTATFSWASSLGSETFTAEGTPALNNWIGGQCLAQFTLANVANAGSATISVNITGGSVNTSAGTGIYIVQMRGTANAVADQTQFNNTSGPPATSMTIGTMTTTHAAAIVVAGISTPSGTTYSVPTTSCMGAQGIIPANSNPGGMAGAPQYVILSGTVTGGSCTWNMGGSTTFTGQMAAYH